MFSKELVWLYGSLIFKVLERSWESSCSLYYSINNGKSVRWIWFIFTGETKEEPDTFAW